MRGAAINLSILSILSIYMLVSRHSGDLEAIATAFAITAIFAGTGYVGDRLLRHIIRRLSDR